MKTAETISISLVDDDRLFLKSLEHLLLHKTKYNVQIKSYQNGEECLRELDQKPDIVVLDYLLNTGNPEAMNGIAVLREIMDRYPSTAVIMLSGQENLQVAVDSIKHGAYDYVIKNESALVKLQNLLRNAINGLLLARQVKNYNLWVKVIVAIILVLLLAAVAIELFFPRIVQ
jgi:two-component system OmpR family response regulator